MSQSIDYTSARNSQSTSSTFARNSHSSDLDLLIREAAEAKLYYLRDTLTPVEFDLAVDQELALAQRNANEDETEPPLKVFAKKLVAKVANKLKRF